MLTIKTNWQNLLRGLLLLVIPLMVLALPAAVMADSASTVDDNNIANVGTDCEGQTSTNDCISKLPLVGDINNVVDAVSALVGVIIVGSLILGGIQYSSAGDNPQAVGAAKKRITNALIALIAFFFTYAFLQWVVPGGVFNS